MTPAEILAEHALGRTPPQSAIDNLKARGVRASVLAATWRREFDFVLADRVVFTPTSFEFARHVSDPDGAVMALTFLARDAAGTIADVVAWSPRAGRLSSWLGRVGLLGEEQVFGPRLSEAMPVHSSPLEWLAARRRGVVVVAAHLAAEILRDAGSLVVPDTAAGKRLRETLTIRLPKIFVSAEPLAEAA